MSTLAPIVRRPAPASPAEEKRFAHRRAAIMRPGVRTARTVHVTTPADPREREADKIADALLSQRTPAGRAVAPSAALASPTIARACAACDVEQDETLLRAPCSAGSSPSPVEQGEAIPLTQVTATRFAQLRGRPGLALPSIERDFFQTRSGRDLSRVRIHADQESAMLSADIKARAFTIGQHIYFGQGQFTPGTSSGRRLIAHELAHTFQGADPAGAGPIARSPAPEANAAAPAAIDQTYELPDDIFLATMAGELGRLPDLGFRLSQLNHAQTLKLHRDVEFYLDRSRKAKDSLKGDALRAAQNTIFSYTNVLKLIENKVGTIKRHQAFTRPALTAPLFTSFDLTDLETTIIKVAGGMHEMDVRFFRHLLEPIRLYLDYLLNGEVPPSMPVSQLARYGYILFEDFKPLTDPQAGDSAKMGPLLTLSTMAPKFQDPALPIAEALARLAAGASTVESVQNKIGALVLAMNGANADIRREGGGPCEGGLSINSRLCTAIHITHCMASSPAYLYSIFSPPGNLSECGPYLDL